MAFSYKELADLIFPDVTETIEDLEKRYPPRNLTRENYVTRFAPSPTGFLHTGSLFTALVAKTFAKQTGGVYYFRLEDTDQKREIKGTGDQLCHELARFGVIQDEGYMGDSYPEKGEYGPYVQSKRADIYKVCIKHLVSIGRAYPCFCSKEELDDLRKVQEINKVIPGYYGEYAKCRNIKPTEAKKLIQQGKPYVIRFRSEGDHKNFIKVHDMVRGDLNLSQNDQDIVILKSDGLPTYHFAHLVDDHFMRSNLITRGEEWLSSLPIHLELFQSMGWEAPNYAHLPVIMVNDAETGNKRKLSKRKDKEASVAYFIQEGYPVMGLIKYLLTIANSNFEEWLLQNPTASVDNFKLSFEKMSLDGALFDLPKLNDISKNVIAYMTKEELFDVSYNWAKEFSPETLAFIEKNKDRYMKIINIERGLEKPRKDYIKYSDIFPKVKFFDEDIYNEMVKGELPYNANISKEVRDNVINAFLENMDYSVDESTWFNQIMKGIAEKLNFAPTPKLYKQNPDQYIGHVGDVAAIIRTSLTCSVNSPNLYQVIQILGKDEVTRRLQICLNK